MDQNLSAPGPVATDYAQGPPPESSPLAQSFQQQAKFIEDFDASQRGSSLIEGDGVRRSDSAMSQSQTLTPSRGGTLKKRNSVKRTGSLKRSSSRRSVGAGSVKSLGLGDREKYDGSDLYSAFFTPVPTKGSPTELLANRFQDWRKVLKDLISYFREVQKSHEARSKSLLGLSNIASNLTLPPGFLAEGGIGEATSLLKQYHKQALQESNRAKGIEDDIMAQLTGLRSDLAQKIKEIKNLSGDFKNAVDKETDSTRKAVRGLQEALEQVDVDPGATSGKGDPYIVRLGVERQIERQIDEENYLHKAFLNLENSGRELESIVVGEIQKAYNAYAGILKREADEAYETVDNLRTGPIMMPKDNEWDSFVSNNEHFVDPRMPIRKAEQIHYPGKDAPAAAEVRAGMLERKSKYLKSYTAGWYVLSPTHLHEFKSPDRLSSQQPVMSLFLQEQKLGSHSGVDSSSHKFMLKGRQAGGMHRGHGWVFRAESHDTMMAWYDDIKNLTEKTGFERDAFVRKHARSVSGGSYAGSVSSSGAIDEDEADRVPYAATPTPLQENSVQEKAPRPQPGGRFPSDLDVNRHLQKPLSPSSGTNSDDRDAITAVDTTSGAAKSKHKPNREIAAGHNSSYDSNQYPEYGSEPRSYPTYETRYSSNSVPVTSSYLPPEHESDPQDSNVPADNHFTHAPNDGPVIMQSSVVGHQQQEIHDVAGVTQHQDPVSPLSQTNQTGDDVGKVPAIQPIAVSSEVPLVVGAAATKTAAPETLATSSSKLPALQPSDLQSPDTPNTPLTSASIMSDSTIESGVRPELKPSNTISDLHIPGGFP